MHGGWDKAKGSREKSVVAVYILHPAWLFIQHVCNIIEAIMRSGRGVFLEDKISFSQLDVCRPASQG